MAVIVCTSPATGGASAVIGPVRAKVAVGCSETRRALSRKYESRLLESVAMDATSTVISASVSVRPSTVSVPETSSVRPTTVTSVPFSTSSTR